jgi:hypothetical protein
MPKPNDDEWGLCDHGPYLPADYRDDDEDEDGEWYEYDELDDDDDDDDPIGASLGRLAAEVKAGRAELPARWKLDWSNPSVLVWTTPSGRRYAFDLAGEPVPLPEPARP